METIKQFSLFSLLLIFISEYSFAQKTSIDKKAIANIRALVQAINTDSSLKMKELDNDEFIDGTDNGSQLNGFFKGDSIYKMEAWIGLSIWTLKTEYFYRHERLIFVYERQVRNTDKDGNVNYDSCTIIFEGRYYLEGNKLIFRREKGQRYYPLDKPIA